MALNDIMGGGQYDAFQQGQQEQQANLASLLKNQTTQAQLPGIQGQSQQQAAAGQLAQANMPQKIAAQSAGLSSQQITDKLKQLTDFGSIASQYGAVLDKLPPPSRAEALTGFAQKVGIPVNHPLIQGLLKNSDGSIADPADIPQKLADMGTKIQQSTQAYIQQQGSIMGRNQGNLAVANVKGDTAKAIQESKASEATLLAGINNTSKEGIAANALKLKQIMFDNKVVSPDQLVAKRTQEYQANPNDDTKQALDQANVIATSLANNRGLFQAYQQANTGANLLGDIAPNTIPKPAVNPVSKFPTTPSPVAPQPAPIAHPAAPTAGALPPGIPPGSKVIGTSGGKPVYEDPQGRRWQ